MIYSKKLYTYLHSIKVTIAGESAGSMSVMALYVSKQTKGLFHNAIAQSGNINAMPKNSHPKCGVE